MRKMLLCVLVVAAAACGKKADSGPDPKKLPPEEACRVISKRVFECKADVISVLGAALKKHGESDDEVAKMTDAFGQPMPCNGADAKDLDQLITCYDHDCKKLAQCFVPMVEDSMRPMGGDKHVEPAEPAEAAGSGTAATP